MENNINCTLTNQELVTKAEQLINDLIETGGKSWVMHVPARPNGDADLIFTELNSRFKNILKELNELKQKGNHLALAWRRLSRSVFLHPDFKNNSEWDDYKDFGDKAHAEWEGESVPEQTTTVFVPCEYGDPRCCGGYTSNDGQGLCYVRETNVPVIEQGAMWVKAIERLPMHDNPLPVKFNGEYQFGNFYENEGGGISFYFSWGGMNGTGISGDDFDRLYWLDETGTANTDYHKLAEENAELRRWKMEATELLTKINSYAHKHLEIKLGQCAVDLVIAMAKERDELKERAEKMEKALNKVIEMNRQHATDQYGDPEIAETWSCVIVAREALACQEGKKEDNNE